jgi:hypothetical protein
MCDNIRIIQLAQSIADLNESELRELAEDLVIHYRGHAMDLESHIGEFRGQRIDSLIKQFGQT